MDKQVKHQTIDGGARFPGSRGIPLNTPNLPGVPKPDQAWLRSSFRENCLVSISSSIEERRKDLARQADTSKDPFIERIAHLVARWGLVTPAIAFLEANKPLSFVGSQALLMFQPITDLIVARELSMELAMLLADRDRVELLLAKLETVKLEHKEVG